MELRLELKHYKQICWYDFVMTKKTLKFIYFKPRRTFERVTTTPDGNIPPMEERSRDGTVC